jgi:hypothetical protein
VREHVRTAYHEAGHALVARDLGRRVDSISVGVGGGFLRQEPLAPNGTDEEIERALVIIFAGAEAEKHAPDVPWQGNGGDPWLTDGELAILAARDENPPSDEAAIEHYTERIGAEAVERARELAAELVERMHAIGRLERLADELLFRGHLTGDDVERLLA